MADEDVDLELQGEEGVAAVSTRERPVRAIQFGTQDTPRALTEEIVELTQRVLDETMDSPEVTQKEIATMLKRQLDHGLGGTWHVIVGSHFGGNVTNDGETLVNFRVDREWFLVFRSGPPEKPADDPAPATRGGETTVPVK